MIYQSSEYFFSFILLLSILLTAKVFLIAYRMASGKWPMSVRFLWRIVEWDKEALKMVALMVAAYVFMLIRRSIS